MAANPSPPPWQHAYYEDRWNQLNNLVISHSEGALTYLLTVNGGAVAGMLAFIGAVTEVRNAPSAIWALSFFVGGLVLSGFARAYALHYMEWLMKAWRTDYGTYLSGHISWQELNTRDSSRANRWEWPATALGYASFLAFLIGLGFAIRLLTQLPPK